MNRYTDYKDSGIDWLGKIPSHWKVSRLKSLAQVRSGPAGRSLSPRETVAMPCSEIEPDWLAKITEADYAKYYFESRFKQSTGLASISATDIRGLPIIIPPLSEQRSIVQYLDLQTHKIDTLIIAKQRLLRLLTEKRCALITHVVTRGLNPDAPLHYSGIDLIGDIPVHWNLIPLKRLLKLIDYGISEPVNIQGKIAVLRVGDICDGEISYDNIGFVEDVDPQLLLKTNDLVFNRTNSLDQVGKVGIFRGNTSFPMSFASSLVRLRCNQLAIPEFLNYQLNSQPMLIRARSEAVVAAEQATLNPNLYSYMLVPLPPVHEQIRIVEYLNKSVKKNYQLCAATHQIIELLQEKRISVISAAVLGKINLS
ncbi:restriction endonuclease subunit S [Leptolyngbya boryana CZ1]|uniref:Restriction endonuclease subunit S n=1 Tax=Leptolyngbya boryana CZ1 TaxID=3060204 RepID=A0AA97AVM2_LEPBY|nr:restriction endonuclease subunit S [Leptolyngbya boryana]WNZ47515.1 restriction endonuclease subunit S [Leptolyngbya boryana CZ1]